MQPIITDNLDKIRLLCQAVPAVRRLYVFGSATRDDFRLDSDIDLLVDLDEELTLHNRPATYFKLESALKRLLDREVDLLTFEMVRNPYFVKELNASAERVYARFYTSTPSRAA